jgi:hypothetical protein
MATNDPHPKKPPRRRGRRKPPNLGLWLLVRHPESEYGYIPPVGKDGKPVAEGDADGHLIHFSMDAWKGEALADVQVRRGMAAPAAAALLRKLADLIERTPALMTARQGVSGWTNRDGEAEVCDLMSLDYDDFGNLDFPEIR